ncbi:MAG: translation initiation factor IF-3 [Bifidobacterium sp.]|nr:translation initiation factor IF-3 [Bifidobacterium sp.]
MLDQNGSMLGIMPTSQAQRMAQDQGLDLVEITPNAQPPVCKIMDYGKFRYEESIKAKQQRKAQKTTQVKEIKFHPGTDIGDLKHKLRQIREFLGEGNKVRLSLQFRGRENAHRDIGEDKIAQVLDMLKDECFVEQAPRTDGRIHSCLIGPPRAKKGGRPSISVSTQPQPPQPPPAGQGEQGTTVAQAGGEMPPNGIHIKIG